MKIVRRRWWILLVIVIVVAGGATAAVLLLTGSKAQAVQGGFKGSSQHRLPEPSVAVRRALLPAFSSRESCAVDC
jgi:flagellar basal body-associated protein FliL